MSKKFREVNDIINQPTTDESMRKFCNRPGKVDIETGRPQYTTEQSHKDICDINNIIAKHDKTGIITHISNIEAKYGDLSGLDYKTMQDTITNASKMFMELPSNIRKRFKNDPMELIKFMEDENNRDEAIKLGIIDAGWTPETDGLGEHVLKDENKDIEDDKEVEED